MVTASNLYSYITVVRSITAYVYTLLHEGDVLFHVHISVIFELTNETMLKRIPLKLPNETLSLKDNAVNDTW